MAGSSSQVTVSSQMSLLSKLWAPKQLEVMWKLKVRVYARQMLVLEKRRTCLTAEGGKLAQRTKEFASV